MPKPTPEQLWELLARSRLVDGPTIARLRAAHAAGPAATVADAKALAAWLVQVGAITRWQARRLAIGDRGPFFLGDYRLLERHDRAGAALEFAARHEPSGRAVGVVLLNAKQAEDPALFAEIVRRTTAASRNADPVLSRTWALEQAGTNRFIVCEIPSGETLAAELQRRGPLPVLEAAEIMLRITQAVASLHAAGEVHGGLSLDVVRREQPAANPASGPGLRVLQFPLVGDPHLVPLRVPLATDEDFAKLGRRASFVAPELTLPGAVCDPRSDVYALGCMFHALLAGAEPCWQGDPRATLRQAAIVGPASLGPPAVPPEIGALVSYMAARDPGGRYPSAVEAAAAIAACLGRPAAAIAVPSLTAAPAGFPTAAGGAAASAWQQALRRHAKRWVAPVVAVLGAALVLAALISGLGRMGGGGTKHSEEGEERRQVALDGAKHAAHGKPDGQTKAGGQTKADGQEKPGTAAQKPEHASATASTAGTSAAAPPSPQAAESEAKPQPRQEIVGDNPNLPWASPTTGPPPKLAYLPPGSQLVLLARLAAVSRDEHGRLFLQALGPEVGRAVAALTKLCGRDQDEIEFVQAGWQPGGPDEIVGGYTIRFVDAGDRSAEREWAGTTAEELEGETVHVGKPFSFWAPRAERGRVLVVAPAAMIKEMIAVIAAAGAGGSGLGAGLPRDLETLVGMLDGDRHVTVFGSPDFLMNGGKKALAGTLANLRGPIAAFCGEELTAVALSLQVDPQNFYAEIDAVATLDVPLDRLPPKLVEVIGQLPEAVEKSCDKIDFAPYGSLLVKRLPVMLRLLAAQLRGGREGKGVVLNTYLPGPAAHNIALAAELALAQGLGGPVTARAAAVAAAAPAAPQDALGKLQKKMSLTFAKDTLEKSIQMVSDEAGVPMEIFGPDLQLEGITKNQSFALDERDKTVEAVLRVILAKANPDGKLVFVVQKKDDEELIAITTRAAVAKRGDKLPPGFEEAGGKPVKKEP